MRLSRKDLGPLLTIVSGGVIGASLSFSFLGSRSDDVPAPEPVVAPALTLEDRFEAEIESMYCRSLSAHFFYRCDVPVPEPVVASYESYRSVEVLQSEEQKALARAVALSTELLESEAAKSAPDPLRRRFLEEYRLRALDRMEQVITDVEKLQEEGWDVTFRPPVFQLPEIRQR